MTDIAIMHEAVCQKQNRRFVSRPHAFRFPEEKPWHRLVTKVREVLIDWLQSIAAAVMLVTILLFAAMAILATIYLVLLLVAFILSILGVA
jgi:hypothetical protein